MAVNLKLGDRLAIIRDGVKKGLTPQQAMLQYQINKDGGYNNWKNQFKQSTGIDPDLDDTYNYELFFKENPEAAKQLLLGKASPDILKMYKTPLAIQREKQILQQRQKGSINSLMDYSLYEKLINDYMNKSVNVSAYGGSINMFVGGGEATPISESASTTNKDDNEITKHERFTQTELEPKKWRSQRLPDFIELTPEELQDIKNYVLEMAYKEDTNRPFRIFHIPKELIVKYHPELENESMQNPAFYIYENEYQDALKNGKKYLRLNWLRESSKEGKLFDEWKKLRKMLYLYDTDRNYATFTDNDTLELEDNAEKNYNLLPGIQVTYDKGTQQQILPQEEPEELEITPVRSGSVAIEPDITKIVQVEDKKLPPLTPTENTLKYIDMSGTTGEELKTFNNNPLNTEGVPGGSSFGNSADGIRIPDVFNLYENYNYNVPYEDFSTYQPEGYQHQPWNIYNLPPSGYVDMPNWNVQQIQDNGDDDKFLNFLNMLANIPQKSDNADLLMTLLMLPKDYFADPYAGEHYTNTANFYDAYNNDPYTKIQRESNGTLLYKSGGRINKFEVGGEPSIEELALLRAQLATSPKNNYHKAIDFVYDPISAMKMAYDKGLSNCTLTASQFYDPEKSITKARTIVTTPHVSGFYEVGEDYAVPGSMVIASLPNGNDYGKNSYHTMILSGYANQDYQFPFKGKVYDIKKGEPLVNYSRGKRESENYVKNIPLKVYLDNSDGKTNVRYYRPYNNDLKAKLLPEIVVTPEGNYILNYLNKNTNILANGGKINKFDGYGSSFIQTPWNDPWKGNPIGKLVAENNARQLLLFQLQLDEYAKKLNEYINAYKNWEYKDIEGEYPILTNVDIGGGETAPVYTIPGSVMAKTFSNYTWGDNLTWEPNTNYYVIKNANGLYASIPSNSYLSQQIDEWKLRVNDWNTQHSTPYWEQRFNPNVDTDVLLQALYQYQHPQPTPPVFTELAQLRQDYRTDYERLASRNQFEYNNWLTDYNKWKALESTVLDKITTPFSLSKYAGAAMKTAENIDDVINAPITDVVGTYVKELFDENNAGLFNTKEGRMYSKYHPYTSLFLNAGMDMLGPKVFKSTIGKPLRYMADRPKYIELTPDANGNITMYHGSPNSNITEFRIDPTRDYGFTDGAYFTDARQAAGYKGTFGDGKIYEVEYPYSQRNVVTIDGQGKKWGSIPEQNVADAFGLSTDEVYNIIGDAANDGLLLKSKVKKYNANQIAKLGRHQGVDAVHIKNVLDRGRRPFRLDRPLDLFIVYNSKDIMPKRSYNSFREIDKDLKESNGALDLETPTLKQPIFTYDPILGYRYTGYKQPSMFENNGVGKTSIPLGVEIDTTSPIALGPGSYDQNSTTPTFKLKLKSVDSGTQMTSFPIDNKYKGMLNKAFPTVDKNIQVEGIIKEGNLLIPYRTVELQDGRKLPSYMRKHAISENEWNNAVKKMNNYITKERDKILDPPNHVIALQDKYGLDFSAKEWFRNRLGWHNEKNPLGYTELDITDWYNHTTEYEQIAEDLIKSGQIYKENNNWYGIINGKPEKLVDPEAYIVSKSKSFVDNGYVYHNTNLKSAVKPEHVEDFIKNAGSADKKYLTWTTDGLQLISEYLRERNGTIFSSLVGSENNAMEQIIPANMAHDLYVWGNSYGTYPRLIESKHINPLTGGKMKGIWRLFGPKVRIKSIRGNNGNFKNEAGLFSYLENLANEQST